MIDVDAVKIWFSMQAQLAELKVKEKLLRDAIFAHYFPEPREGTNKVEVDPESKAMLVGNYSFNRSVDIGELSNMRKAQAERAGVDGLGLDDPDPNLPVLPFDELIKWKPELSLSAYRKLTKEQQIFFDQCLIIKPGSPALEVVFAKGE